jgi:hypothetical protein
MNYYVARSLYAPLSVSNRDRFLSPGLRDLHYKDSHLHKRAFYSLGEYLREPDITIKLRAPLPNAADDEPLTLASNDEAASSIILLLHPRAIHSEAYCRAFGRSISLISSRSGESLGLSSLTLHYKDRNLCNVHGRLSFPCGMSDLTLDSALYGRCSEEHPAKSGVVLDYASVRIDHCTLFLRADLVTRKLCQSGAASFGAMPLYNGLSLL